MPLPLQIYCFHAIFLSSPTRQPSSLPLAFTIGAGPFLLRFSGFFFIVTLKFDARRGDIDEARAAAAIYFATYAAAYADAAST